MVDGTGARCLMVADKLAKSQIDEHDAEGALREAAERIEAMAAELARLRAESMRGAVEGYASAVEKLRHCLIVTGTQPLETIRDAVAVWLEAHAPEQQAASQAHPECRASQTAMMRAEKAK